MMGVHMECDIRQQLFEYYERIADNVLGEFARRKMSAKKRMKQKTQEGGKAK